MSKFMSRLLAVALAACATLVVAPAANATVTVSTPKFGPWTFFGLNVEFWVWSDRAAPIYIRQIRADNLVGPGRCRPRGDSWLDVNFVGEPLRVIPYPTADLSVKVTIPASRLKMSGGDPKAPTYYNPGGTGEPCQDFVTRYNRIGAFQEDGPFREGDTRKLTRLF